MINQQLQDFVKNARRQGKTDEQIKSELLDVGWLEGDINSILNVEPGSFKFYKGRAPWPLQIVGGLMWLQGLQLIFSSLFYGLFLWAAYGVLGLFIVPGLLVFGVLIIKCAKGVFKMKANIYKKVLVYQIILLGGGLFYSFYEGIDKIDFELLFGTAFTVVNIILIYFYRDRFVN